MIIDNLSENQKKERAFLVGVLLPNKKEAVNGFLGEPPVIPEEPLTELAGLAEAAGAEVVGELIQRRQKPETATYIGSGKVEELCAMIESSQADLAIFDNDLSPGQKRNLEKALKVKVLDRTELILDIFATRAQTREARLAVELAQLEYQLPRLKRMWTHLSRQKMGVGARGPGEKQLESDKRLAQKRISDLKSELEEVQKRKEREVLSRNETRTVSLVGYTNAGKSTLMNALTGSDVFVKDQLFATLDTRTRRWSLPGWGPVLLSDTVGFIRDLPHQLIASFRATLEEARCADLLLHVADGSNPMIIHQIQAAYSVLEEMGIQEKDTLLVINKIDILRQENKNIHMRYIKNGENSENETEMCREILAEESEEKDNEKSAYFYLPPAQRLHVLENRYPNAIGISAVTGEGLERLAKAVSEMLSRNFPVVDVEMTAADGKLLAFLAERGEVFDRHFDENGRVVVRCRIAQAHLGKITDLKIKIKPVENF
ncbi:MAG: GTPase HflX [Planctomycetia bacterium]|nr:GTPase HflX [Planctomycetia bacterium]